MPSSSRSTSAATADASYAECHGRPLPPDAAGPRFCSSCHHGHSARRGFERGLEATFGRRAGLPPRLASATLGRANELHGTDPDWRDALATLCDAYRIVKAGALPERGALLMGPAGIGKSGAVAGLTRNLRALGRPVLWLRWDTLVSAEQASYGTAEARAPLTTAQRVRFLVLDDLGDAFARRDRAQASEDQRRILYELVAHRTERLLPTWITTNHADLASLARQFDARTVDRLREGCTVHALAGPSLRGRETPPALRLVSP